jgi:Obg family GTPase CgtA
MFVDRVRIVARAGNGGPGACSFLREKNMPDGGPDGGNGGRGGSVLIVVDPHVNNLIKYRYAPHQFAKNGQNGGKKQMSGRSGIDCIISVPPGTVVSRIPEAAVSRRIWPACRKTQRCWSKWPISSKRATSLSFAPAVAAVAAT